MEARDYKEVIARRAENGWRYVGFLPVEWINGNTLAEMDLIFEKEL